MSGTAKHNSWNTGDALVLVVVGLLFILLSPILVPLILFALIREAIDRIRFRRFLSRNEGARFFCYTTKAKGLEFAQTHILPRLGPDVQIILMSARGSVNMGDESPMQALVGRVAGGAKRGGYPCVAKVVDGELVSESLNTEFYRTIMRDGNAEPLLTRIMRFYSEQRANKEILD